MSSSNYIRNKAFVDKFHEELVDMLDDVAEIDKKVLNRAVGSGVRHAKDNSPVITGFFRKKWRTAPAVRSKDGCATKTLVNSAEYASFVNYGHRTVDKEGNITGYVKSVKGDHLLEKTVSFVDKQMGIEFEKEVKAVQQKHDK